MELKKQIENNFRKELNILLEKYDAEIYLTKRGSAYMEYDVIEVTIASTYNKKTFEDINPMVQFDL